MKRLISSLICITLIMHAAGCAKPSGTRAHRDKLEQDKALLMVKKKIERMYEREQAQSAQLNIDLGVLQNRNPFTMHASGAASGEVSDYVLTGIIWNEESPAAIINDSIVTIGDIVGKRRVKEITRSKVILIEGVNEYILRLKSY